MKQCLVLNGITRKVIATQAGSTSNYVVTPASHVINKTPVDPLYGEISVEPRR